MTNAYIGPIVALPNGEFTRKRFDDLLPSDKVVIGSGPDHTDSALMAKREFESEIAAAGGLESWRKQAKVQPQPA